MSPENQGVFQLQKKETHTSHKTTLIVAVRSVRGGLPETNWKLFVNPEGGGSNDKKRE